MEASLSRLLFLTVSYARWLPLEHESALSFPLCSYRKTLIPKKWNTQKHLPLHLWCAHLSCKKKNPTPLQTQCSESTELWYKNSLIHVLLQWRTAHFTRYLPLCLEDWKKKKRTGRGVILPSVALLTPCYLKVTAGGRNLSRAVFHKTHLSSPHHMCSSQSFLQTQFACGGWRSYLIRDRRIKCIISHFTTDLCNKRRKSHPKLHVWLFEMQFLTLTPADECKV